MRAKQKERRGDNKRKRDRCCGTITLELEGVMSWHICVPQWATVLNYSVITYHYRGKDRSSPVQTAEPNEAWKRQLYTKTTRGALLTLCSLYSNTQVANSSLIQPGPDTVNALIWSGWFLKKALTTSAPSVFLKLVNSLDLMVICFKMSVIFQSQITNKPGWENPTWCGILHSS